MLSKWADTSLSEAMMLKFYFFRAYLLNVFEQAVVF